MALKVTNQLVLLPNEIRIDKVVSHAHSFELFLTIPEPAEQHCPHCGSTDCVIKDSGRSQTVRHIAISGAGTMLTFHRLRYLCKECGRSFYEQLPWIHPKLHMTSRLFLNICEGLFSIHSISDIAMQNCVTVSVVHSVLDTVDFGRPLSLPETLCIDEFKGPSGFYDPVKKSRGIHDYHCNIANGDLFFYIGLSFAYCFFNLSTVCLVHYALFYVFIYLNLLQPQCLCGFTAYMPINDSRNLRL